MAVRLVEPTIGVAATDNEQQRDGLRLVVTGLWTDGEGPSPLPQQERGFRVLSVAGQHPQDLDEQVQVAGSGNSSGAGVFQ